MYRLPEPPRAFVLGDHVKLIAGGPDMRVIGFALDNIWCSWTVAAQSKSQAFPSAALRCA